MTRNTLDPETRLLYGDCLQAPPGYRFDAGVATTFSLDFETALAVPVSLALFAADNREEILQHPIALLEGAERIAGRLAVFAEAERRHGPLFTALGIGGLFPSWAATADIVRVGGRDMAKTGRYCRANPRLTRVL